MTTRQDPTRPLTERTPDELGEFIDTHLLWALEAADLLQGERRFGSEDYLRDRIVALSDTYEDAAALHAESVRRRSARLRDALSIGDQA